MAQRVALLCVGPALALLGGLSCSDSLHLDPGAGGNGPGGPGAGPGGDGGDGGAPILCSSSSDCPAPKAVCDTIRGECVECLEIDDCPYPSLTVCSMGHCVCPTEGESVCGPTVTRPPRCANLATSSPECGTCGHSCYGACADGKCVDAWEPTSTEAAPLPRWRHVAVWTGTTMVVWGGATASGFTNTGGIYNPSTSAWTATSTANAPTPRSLTAAVWTGTHMIVWGGFDGGALGTGAVFDPSSNTWAAMSSSGAPGPRYSHTMVWTDKPSPRACVFGGQDGTDNLGNGACYDPTADKWTAMATLPSSRREHTAIWTGSRMVVFGGIGSDGVNTNEYLGENVEYDPVANAWSGQVSGEPSPRARHAAIWTGSAMIVWGGATGGSPGVVGDGGSYKPSPQPAWSSLGGPLPEARELHTAVWVGTRMIVWGGAGASGLLNTGGLYDPVSGQWDAKPMPTGPEARHSHTAVATEDKWMIIWGGNTAAGTSNTGGIFNPKR